MRRIIFVRVSCIVAVFICFWAPFTQGKTEGEKKKDEAPAPPVVPEALKKLEDQYYFAPRAGLKDLEVRMSGAGFAELKAKAPGFSATFYWKAPDKIKVKVAEIPEKANINVPLLEERLAKELGETIIKRPFSDQPENFEAFKEEKVEGNTVVAMIPKDKTSALVETAYVIAPDNTLKTVMIAVRTKTGEIDVYEGKTTTTQSNGKLLTKETLLACGKDKSLCARYEYTEVTGFMLPSRFVQTAVAGPHERTFELVLTDHKINQGLADSVFAEPAEEEEREKN
jgi:hypothetical protein